MVLEPNSVDWNGSELEHELELELEDMKRTHYLIFIVLAQLEVPMNFKCP